jgi:chloramphenicol O-acetyltransferase type A
MKEILLATWRRKEHFEFFKRVDLPFYNVNANINVTGLKEASKVMDVSLNTLLIFITMKAINKIENLKYRLRGESVILHETLHPVFAHIAKNDDLFRMIAVDFSDDILVFKKRLLHEISVSVAYFDPKKLLGRDDAVFISALPWIEFTGTDHTMSLKKEDAIPRITWGKIHVSENKMLLPYNIQVNHMFVDGIHVGYFFEELNCQIKDILKVTKI